MYRGQVVTTDLIFALTVAIAIIFIINSQWGIMLKNFEDGETKIAAEKAAYISTFYLINGKGYPVNWNSSNVSLLGLAKDLNIIDGRKFTELMKIDNASLGNFLGAPEYKFFINLTKKNDVTINSTGYPPINPSISTSVMSFVVFNTEISKLYVTVWK